MRYTRIDGRGRRDRGVWVVLVCVLVLGLGACGRAPGSPDTPSPSLSRPRPSPTPGDAGDAAATDAPGVSEPTPLPPTPSLAATFTATPMPTPTPGPERIEFEPGGTGATVSGHLAAGDARVYVLRASRGQTMAIEGPGEDVDVVVRGGAGPAGAGYGGPVGRDGWCGILPRSGEYAIEVAAPERGADYALTVTVGAEVLDLPPMVFAVGHQIGEERTFLFVNRDGAARVVGVEGVLGCDAAAGRRVFCDDYYVDVGGAVAIDAPEVLERCRGPLPGPSGTQGPRDDDGQRLAWMCDDLDYGAIMEGQTPEARFELVLTDVRGRDPRVVWAETLTGSDYAPPRLRDWRADGAAVYVPKFGPN